MNFYFPKVINKFAQKQEADGDEEEDGEEEEETEEDEEEDKVIMDDMEEMEKAAEETNSVDDNEMDGEASESEEAVNGVETRCPLVKEVEENLVPEMETGGTDAVDRKATDQEAPALSVDTKAEEGAEDGVKDEFRCVILPPPDDVVDVDGTDRDTLSLSGDSERSFSPALEHGGKSEMTEPATDIVCETKQVFVDALDSDVSSGQKNTEMDIQKSVQGAFDLPGVTKSSGSVTVSLDSSSGVAVCCDVICLDDDVLSPQKSKSDCCDLGGFGAAKTLDLETGKRNVQNGNATGKLEENGSMALVPWQPGKEQVGDEAALLSDDDVIVINSGNTPSKSSSSFQTTEECQTSLLNGGEHCIMSTVEEQVTTTVTHSQMSSGNHSSVVEQKTMRRRVIGHIVCFNNLRRGGDGHQTASRFPSGVAGRGMRDASRGSRVNDRNVPFSQRDRCTRVSDYSPNRGFHRARQQGAGMTSSGGRRTDGSRATGHSNSRQHPPRGGQFHLDLDKISREIASSVFKNPPPGKTVVTQDPDVVICDDSALSLPPTVAEPSAFDCHLPVNLSSSVARSRDFYAPSKRLRPQKPSKSKAALGLLPTATGASSSVAEPLKAKNSNISEIIELD